MMKKFVAAVAMAALAYSPLAASPVITPMCALGGLKAKLAPDQVSTKSTSYKQMPDMGFFFNQGSAGCVVVQFSAEVSVATDGARMLIRAVLDDGAIQPEPFQDVFFTTDVTPGAHAFNFVFTGVPAGNHKASVLWAAGGVVADITVGARNRSMIVQFAP